jgi:hypothetical protein
MFTMTDDSTMTDDRAENWLRLKHEAAARLDEPVTQALTDAAHRSWGRGFLGMFGPTWQLLRRPDDVSWRAARYLGTASDQDHRYSELGVTAHLDPKGNLVGYGVDNGVDFIGLHDTTPYGLQRGLEYIRQQRPRIRSYDSPLFDHALKPPRT